MDICGGCKERGLLQEGLCESCRKELSAKLGLFLEALPVQRPAGPCRKCLHVEIVQALVRERGASGCDYTYPFLRPLAVAHGALREHSHVVFGDKDFHLAPDLETYWGVLVAYICRRCGNTEMYTVAPEQIPIGVWAGTKLLSYSDAPYR